jgi:hypothetical protein
MFAAIGFALKYLPLIVSAVQLIENFVDNGTDGATKKALATKFIVDALRKLNVTVTARTEDIIGTLIDLIVTVLNAFGFFKSTEGVVEEAVVVASPVARETRVTNDERLDELEAILTR